MGCAMCACCCCWCGLGGCCCPNCACCCWRRLRSRWDPTGCIPKRLPVRSRCRCTVAAGGSRCHCRCTGWQLCGWQQLQVGHLQLIPVQQGEQAQPDHRWHKPCLWPGMLKHPELLPRQLGAPASGHIAGLATRHDAVELAHTCGAVQLKSDGALQAAGRRQWQQWLAAREAAVAGGNEQAAAAAAAAGMVYCAWASSHPLQSPEAAAP